MIFKVISNGANKIREKKKKKFGSHRYSFTNKSNKRKHEATQAMHVCKADRNNVGNKCIFWSAVARDE